MEPLGDRQAENLGGISRITFVRLETGRIVAHRAQDIHDLAAPRSHIEHTKARFEDGPKPLEAVHRDLACSIGMLGLGLIGGLVVKTILVRVELPHLLWRRAWVGPDQPAPTANHRTQVIAVAILRADLLCVGRAAQSAWNRTLESRTVSLIHVVGRVDAPTTAKAAGDAPIHV